MLNNQGFFGGNGGDENHAMSEINTTPLVDVMLVLLVIFIIAAPLLTHAVKIDLPQATSQPVDEKPSIVTLSIDDQNQLYWNDQPLDKNALKAKIDEASKQSPQPEIHIRADQNTRYQILADVMADAQNAGLSKLGFLSEPK